MKPWRAAKASTRSKLWSKAITQKYYCLLVKMIKNSLHSAYYSAYLFLFRKTVQLLKITVLSLHQLMPWSIIICQILNLWRAVLTLPAPCISESYVKINLSFYFHTSLWCLKRFYEGLKGLHKTFWGTTKKCENKNLSWFFSLCLGLGLEELKKSSVKFILTNLMVAT